MERVRWTWPRGVRVVCRGHCNSTVVERTRGQVSWKRRNRPERHTSVVNQVNVKVLKGAERVFPVKNVFRGKMVNVWVSREDLGEKVGVDREVNRLKIREIKDLFVCLLLFQFICSIGLFLYIKMCQKSCSSTERKIWFQGTGSVS